MRVSPSLGVAALSLLVVSSSAFAQSVSSSSDSSTSSSVNYASVSSSLSSSDLSSVSSSSFSAADLSSSVSNSSGLSTSSSVPSSESSVSSSLSGNAPVSANAAVTQNGSPLSSSVSSSETSSSQSSVSSLGSSASVASPASASVSSSEVSSASSVSSSAGLDFSSIINAQQPISGYSLADFFMGFYQTLVNQNNQLRTQNAQILLGDPMHAKTLEASLSAEQDNNSSSASGSVVSSGLGTGFFTLKDRTLHYNITVTGLTGPITGAHFHKGAVGVAGSIIEPITFVGDHAEGDWTGLTDDQRNDLLGGQLYVNVHTSQYPNGEIRGQVVIAQ